MYDVLNAQSKILNKFRRIKWITPQEWADALRSLDAPPQTTGAACRKIDDDLGINSENIGYCALGILAKESGATARLGSSNSCYPKLDLTFPNYKIVEGYMSSPSSRPKWLSKEQARKAITLNDSAHKSFDEIADWIEETFCND